MNALPKIGTTAVRLEPSDDLAGKTEQEQLKAIGAKLTKNGIRVVLEGAQIFTGAQVQKASWEKLAAAAKKIGMEPNDLLRALDAVAVKENKGATIDFSASGELRSALGLTDGVDGNFDAKAKASTQKPKTLPPVSAPPPGKVRWPELSLDEVRGKTTEQKAAAYDAMMEKKIATSQLFTKDGLDFGQNCIASSKVTMLKAAGIVRSDASPMDVIRRAKALGLGEQFSEYSTNAPKDELTKALRKLATDPEVGTGVPSNATVSVVKSDGAMKAMDDGGVVLAYVDYGGTANHHVVAMYKNPYNGQTMAIDPLRPEDDATPHIFPLSMDPANTDVVNEIRVSHTRFWKLD